MVVTTTSEEVFACYHRLCAPPPVGKGGSSRGGKAGARAWARRTGIQIAKRKRDSATTTSRFGGKGAKGQHEAGPTKEAGDLTKRFGTRRG